MSLLNLLSIFFLSANELQQLNRQVFTRKLSQLKNKSVFFHRCGATSCSLSHNSAGEVVNILLATVSGRIAPTKFYLKSPCFSYMQILIPNTFLLHLEISLFFLFVHRLTNHVTFACANKLQQRLLSSKPVQVCWKGPEV